MQVWLQSRQTRLTLRMPTRAVSICQVDDLKLLRPGSELLVTNDHNDGPGALLVGVLCRLGLASFSRLGPFCAAIWFCGLRLMFCRGRGVRGHAAGQGDGCGGRRLQNLTIVLVCVCLFASVSCFCRMLSSLVCGMSSEWSLRRVGLPHAAPFAAKPGQCVHGRILCAGTSVRDRDRAHSARTALDLCVVV